MRQVEAEEKETVADENKNSLLDMYAEIIQENTDEAGQGEKMHVEVQVNI